MNAGQMFGTKSLFITDEEEQNRKINHLKSNTCIVRVFFNSLFILFLKVADSSEVELFTLDRKNLIYVPENIRVTFFFGFFFNILI